MGRSARREEGAYLNRYVTDEQRRRRPIFNATLRAAAGWLFFRVARSLRINPDILVARALNNSQLTFCHIPATYETMHQQHGPPYPTTIRAQNIQLLEPITVRTC